MTIKEIASRWQSITLPLLLCWPKLITASSSSRQKNADPYLPTGRVSKTLGAIFDIPPHMLAWRILQGQRSLVGYSSWSRKEPDMTEVTENPHMLITLCRSLLENSLLIQSPNISQRLSIYWKRKTDPFMWRNLMTPLYYPVHLLIQCPEGTLESKQEKINKKTKPSDGRSTKRLACALQ